MIGFLLQSLGAFAIIIGAVAYGFTHSAKTPVYLVWGGLAVMVVGIFS